MKTIKIYIYILLVLSISLYGQKRQRIGEPIDTLAVGNARIDSTLKIKGVARTTFFDNLGSNNKIQNSTVESNAAIAGTKISPDFGSQNIITTGKINIDSTGSESLNVYNGYIGLNRSSISHPANIRWQNAGVNKWEIGLDASISTNEYVLAYSYNVPGDILRMSTNSRMVFGPAIDTPLNYTPAAQFYVTTNDSTWGSIWSKSISSWAYGANSISSIGLYLDAQSHSWDAVQLPKDSQAIGNWIHWPYTTAYNWRLGATTEGYTKFGIYYGSAASTAAAPGSLVASIDSTGEFSLRSATGNVNLRLTNTGAESQTDSTIGYIGAGTRVLNPDANFAKIKFKTDATTWYLGKITFETNGVDGTNAATQPVERMVINYSGNVGIGDTTPDAKLDVEGGGILASDSLRIGSSSDVWVRKARYNAADSSLAFTFYNTALARLDTVYAYQKKY